MYETKVLGLEEARTAIETVLAAAAADGGVPVVVTVVDPDGGMIAFARMDGAGYLPRSMATRKAYTSARMGADSGLFGERMRQAGIDLKDFADPMVSGFAGAVCLRVDGGVVGAIGGSGRSEEQDEALARRGATAIGF